MARGASLSSILLLSAVTGGAVEARAAEGDVLSRMVDDFATCVVRTDPEAARRIVLADDWWTDTRPMARLIRTSCGRELRRNEADFIPDMPVGALATALVQADNSEAGPESLAERPATHVSGPVREASTRVARARATYARARALNARVGDCIARSDPAGTRNWIVGERGSQDEADQFPTFASARQNCLAQAGWTWIDRNAVALSYYRLANSTPRQASGATK